MILTTYILLSIYFILPLHGTYYLVVPFLRILLHNNRGTRFQYNHETHDVFRDMCLSVIQDFSFMPRSHLLLEETGVRLGNRFNVSDRVGKYIKVYSMRHDVYFDLMPNEIPINAVNVRNEWMYKCNENLFTTYGDARRCTDDLIKYSRLKSQSLILGKNLESKNIWHKVWDGCLYKCFTKNNFIQLKTRLFKELNSYRKLLNLRPLKFNKVLSQFAQSRAHQNCGINIKKKMHIKDKSIKEVSNSLSPPFGLLQMNKWYNQFLETKSQIYLKKLNFKNLHILFSQKPSEIGFGVGRKGPKLIIVCEFK